VKIPIAFKETSRRIRWRQGKNHSSRNAGKKRKKSSSIYLEEWWKGAQGSLDEEGTSFPHIGGKGERRLWSTSEVAGLRRERGRGGEAISFLVKGGGGRTPVFQAGAC